MQPTQQQIEAGQAIYTNAPEDPAIARRRAKALGLLAFLIAAAISVFIGFTQDSFDSVDILLIIGVPVALAVIGYIVGYYHSDDADGA